MRRAPITPLPSSDDPKMSRLISTLEQVLGFMVPLLVVSLVREEAGLTLTPAGGAGTTLVSTTDTTDWLDTGADEWRLVGWAEDTSDVNALVRYVVNGVTLAEATVPPTTAGSFVGAWTRISTANKPTVAGDRLGVVKVIGDAVGSVTIYSLVLQARTVTRVV